MTTWPDRATADFPKLRSDLDCRVQTTPDGTGILMIKDPVRRQFFRLQNAERFIAEQLDGATPVPVLRDRVEEKFGASVGPEVLAGFIKTLDRNHLLERPGDAERRKRAEPGRFAGGLLNLRFKVFDPDRLLNRLVGRVGFCFTRQFLFVSAALICAAVALLVLNWGDFVHDASQLYRFSTLPLLIATVFVVITAHEFAHGLTCKHFGGEVHEMGFLLIYLQPAFYCNVSDAWFFSKAQRLWVSFAGPYFELFLWALATLAWRVTATDTWINHITLIVMATSGIKTLFNFNPLLKLDGYYLLSDYLGIPNLRKKSFRYLGDFVKTLGGLRGSLPEVSPRQKRIYLTYGLIAWVASVSFLTAIAIFIGSQLIVEQQRLAFFAFTGIISLRYRSRLRRLFGWKSNNSGTPERKGRFDLSRRNFIIAAAVLLILFVIPIELRVAGSINVLPSHNADVRAEVEGIVEELFVDEGQRVNPGDPIARLNDRDVRSELQKTEAEMEENRARLKILQTGSRPEELELARASVARYEEQLRFHRERLEHFKALNDQELISKVEFEENARRLASGESDLEEAKKKLELLIAGSRPEEIEALNAKIASLDSERRLLDEKLRLMTVLSPAAGVITTPSRQLKAMSRQLVKKGDLIAKVHDFRTVTAEIAVSEKEIADVRTGQKVALKVQAYPERVFPGKVTEIATTVQGAAGPAPSADSADKSESVLPTPGGGKSGANTILVTTEIDNAANLLKPGMTGMAKIYCGKRQIFTLITRRLSRTFRVEFWSWW